MPFSSKGFSSRAKVSDGRVQREPFPASSCDLQQKEGLRVSLESAEEALDDLSSMTLAAIRQEQSETRELRQLVEELLNKLLSSSVERSPREKWPQAEQKKHSVTSSAESRGSASHAAKPAATLKNCPFNLRDSRFKQSSFYARNSSDSSQQNSKSPKEGESEKLREVSLPRNNRHLRLNKVQPLSSNDERSVFVEEFSSDDSKVSPVKTEVRRHVFRGNGFEIFWLSPRGRSAPSEQPPPSLDHPPTDVKEKNACNKTSSQCAISSRTNSTCDFGEEAELRLLVERARAALKQKDGLSVLLQLLEEIFGYLRAALKHSRTKEKVLRYAVKQLTAESRQTDLRRSGRGTKNEQRERVLLGSPPRPSSSATPSKLPEEKLLRKSRQGEIDSDFSLTELLEVPPHPWSVRATHREEVSTDLTGQSCPSAKERDSLACGVGSSSSAAAFFSSDDYEECKKRSSC